MSRFLIVTADDFGASLAEVESTGALRPQPFDQRVAVLLRVGESRE